MTEQPDNLQELNNDVSIMDEASSNTVDSAAGNTAEDTPTNPQQEIINQQKSTIDALMQRTEELTKQINTLLAMGVQISDGNNNIQNESKPDDIYSNDYVSLSDLGASIGKSQ